MQQMRYNYRETCLAYVACTQYCLKLDQVSNQRTVFLIYASIDL